VIESVGKDPERKCLDAGDGLVTSGAVAKRTGQVANLGNPPAVVLAAEFDREAHAHAGNVARLETAAEQRSALDRRRRVSPHVRPIEARIDDSDYN
jgi:hypothetical protein